MAQKHISTRAALIAVFTALITGFILSLTVRPIDPDTNNLVSVDESLGQARIRWRVPVVFQTTWPVLGDNPVFVAEKIKIASKGEVVLDIFEPNEIVPPFSITDAVRDQKIEAKYLHLLLSEQYPSAWSLGNIVLGGMKPTAKS